MRRLWARQDNDKFKDMWESGVRIREIMMHFGVHYHTVVARARRLGLPSRVDHTGAYDDLFEYQREIEYAHVNGISLEVIARDLGTTGSRLWNFLHLENKTKNTKKPEPASRAR